MVGRPLEQHRRADADQDRQRDAPANRRDQLQPAALPQIREADGDDEEGFEPFAERDDERLVHVKSVPLKMRLSLRISVQCTPAYPTGQVGDSIKPEPRQSDLTLVL